VEGGDLDGSQWFDVVTGLLGGVAVFLLGFERLTRSLQAATGSRLADLLSRASSRPLVGAMSGALVTGIIQSSSVTTVLTVGFVSASVITVQQALGIIAGANLGTTVTVQVVAFDVTRFAALMVAVGFALSQWKRRPAWSQPGGALLGLGLVFLGMDLMGAAVAPLRDEPLFVDLLAGAGGPLAALLVGAAFTALIQSSSATVGIVVVLASQGLVDLPTAIALALGAKIGTCVTAAIAAIGRGVAAKRTAAFHVLLNLGGALLWLPLIGPLSDLVVALSPSAPELTGTARLAAETPRQLANAYTLFTAVNLLLVIGFTRPIARGLERLIPERAVPEPEPSVEVRHLDRSALRTPSVALELARRELGRLGRLAVGIVRAGGDAALRGTKAELAEVKASDDAIDDLREAIVTYLADLGRAEVSDEESDELVALIGAADELEAIGDVVETNLVRLGKRRLKEGFEIAASTRELLAAMHERVTEDLALAVHALEGEDRAAFRALLAAASEVTAQRDAALVRQATRLTDRGPERMAAYSREVELVAHLYRIHTHTRRLAERQLGIRLPTPSDDDQPETPSPIGGAVG
jgi:phosphate:Na+ symporter